MFDSLSLDKASIKYLVISTLLLLVTLYYYVIFPEGKEISAYCVATCVLFLVKFRKSMPILILFVFIYMYVYESTKFFFGGIKVSGYVDYNNEFFINKVLFINTLFVYALGNGVSRKLVERKLDFHNSLKSKYLFFILFVIALIMFQFGIQGKTVFESGMYAEGLEKSSMHEYFILVFFLLLLTNPKDSKIYNISIYFLYFIYVLKTMVYGGRIEVLEITLLLVFYNWILLKKVKNYIFWIFASVAYYLSSVVGNIRTHPLALLNGDWEPLFNPFYSENVRNKVVLKNLATNQGDVLQSSARMLGLIEEGILNLSTRILSFITMLLSIFVPSSLLPKYSNLAGFGHEYLRSGGGGLLSVCFYVWMGYMGPFVIGIFLAYFINKGFNSQRIAFKIYTVILLVMFPRWYAYSPIVIFKFCFMTVVLYFIFKIIYGLFFKATPKVI